MQWTETIFNKATIGKQRQRLENEQEESFPKHSLGLHDTYDLVYLFMVGGLVGTVYELILIFVIHGVIEDRSGSIITPFNYVYGLGAVIIFFVFRKSIQGETTFIIGALLGGVVEYVLSLGLEIIFGVRSWDYSARFLNIQGRTTIPYMLVWGVLCLIATHFLFPALIHLLHKIPEHVRKGIAIVFLAVICLDAVLTVEAVARYAQRADGVFYDSMLAQWLDYTFNDGFMKLHFPNMILQLP